MADIPGRKSSPQVWRSRPLWDQDPEQLAHMLMQIFGVATAGKAIELTRMQTEAGNRDAAVKWHRVMSLIEEAGKNR